MALVSMTHSITALPREFITAIEMLSLCKRFNAKVAVDAGAGEK
jgi:hypothetical protein